MNKRRNGQRFLLLLFPLASLLLPASAYPAQPENGAPAPGAPSAESPSSPQPAAGDAFRYRVVIDAPPAIGGLIAENANLVRWQSFEDMSEALFDRLVREAVDQAREAAAVQGFFNAKVDIAVDRGETPAVVTVKVTPGEPVRVAHVGITVRGAAAADPGRGATEIASLRENWLLPRGSVWRQELWTRAKQDAVETLTAGPYAAARIETSEARIDPDANSAVLRVDLDSGPAFHYGDLDVRGLARYPESLVRNFSTLAPGTPYDARELNQFVRRLASSGFFSSVRAAISTDPDLAERAPVEVAVIEGRTRKLEGGIGYSTDTEFRANASYSDVNVLDRAIQFFADARLEQKAQGAALRFVLPPTETHWRDTYAVAFLRTDIENLITETASVTARRASVEERNQRAFGLGFFLDQQQPQGQDTASSHALYADYSRTWRRVDDLIAPTRGFILDLAVGASVPGVSTRTFGRAVMRFGLWHPLTSRNDLSARFALGAVLAGSRNGIPSTFLFRTGGDTSVRGYAFESIGVQQGSAVVGGRYEAIASVEATHWITDVWGLAAFADAGNATDQLSRLADLQLGYGIGARVRTPIGPFRFDLAYGQQSRSLRLHFSVGLSF